MPKKKVSKKKTAKKAQTPEELIAGLRGRGGHLPTKASVRKKKKNG